MVRAQVPGRRRQGSDDERLACTRAARAHRSRHSKRAPVHGDPDRQLHDGQWLLGPFTGRASGRPARNRRKPGKLSGSADPRCSARRHSDLLDVLEPLSNERHEHQPPSLSHGVLVLPRHRHQSVRQPTGRCKRGLRREPNSRKPELHGLPHHDGSRRRALHELERAGRVQR